MWGYLRRPQRLLILKKLVKHDQHMKYAAPKHWLKCTTSLFLLLNKWNFYCPYFGMEIFVLLSFIMFKTVFVILVCCLSVSHFVCFTLLLNKSSAYSWPSNFFKKIIWGRKTEKILLACFITHQNKMLKDSL